jgi:hypothetical protein
MRTHYRTSRNTGVSFGCIGSTIIGFAALAVLGLAAAVVLPVLAVALAAFLGWFCLWVMPTSIYQGFSGAYDSTRVGWGAVLVYLAGLVAVTVWVL